MLRKTSKMKFSRNGRVFTFLRIKATPPFSFVLSTSLHHQIPTHPGFLLVLSKLCQSSSHTRPSWCTPFEHTLRLTSQPQKLACQDFLIFPRNHAKLSSVLCATCRQLLLGLDNSNEQSLRPHRRSQRAETSPTTVLCWVELQISRLVPKDTRHQ